MSEQLTDKDRLKIALLLRAQARGLSAEKLAAMAEEDVEKTANALLLDALGVLRGWGEKGVGTIVDAAKSVGTPVLQAGLATAALAPVAVGAAGGYALGRGADVTTADVKEQQSKELVEAYRNAAAQVRLNNQLAERRRQRTAPTGRSL